MSLKLLEKQFTGKGNVKGYEFSQISFTEAAYLYEVKQNDVIHYEIIKRLKSAVCVDFEKREFSDTDFKEIYPKDERFGTDAICFRGTEKEAINKLNEFSNKINSYD